MSNNIYIYIIFHTSNKIAVTSILRQYKTCLKNKNVKK